MTALTRGYVLAYGGVTEAAGTPTQVARRIKEIFTLLQISRGQAPPNAIAGRKRMPAISPTPKDYTPMHEEDEPQGGFPGGSPPGTEPAITINIEQSKANLVELSRRRVLGQITDSEFFQYCETYCIGIPEDIWVEFLDATMENAAPPHIPGEQGAASQQNGVALGGGSLMVGGKAPTGLNEHVRPQDLVDDYVVDDTTGQVLRDGR